MAAMTSAIDVGTELGPLRLTLSSAEVKRYAIVARMPGGRFMGDEEAQREGLPGQIVPGNFSLSLFARLIHHALPDFTLQHLSGTFRGLVRPSVPLVLHGVVTERHVTGDGERLDCDLILESAEGDRLVTGTAKLQLASP